MVMANFILLTHSLLLCIIEPIASRIYYWSIRQLVNNYLRQHPMKVTINFYIIVLFKNIVIRVEVVIMVMLFQTT